MVGRNAVMLPGTVHFPYSLVAFAHQRTANLAAEAGEEKAHKVAHSKKAAGKAALVSEARLTRRVVVCQLC